MNGDKMTADWVRILDNQKPITSIYGSVLPQSNEIQLFEVSLSAVNREVLLRFDIKEYPIDVPAKWSSSYSNCVQILLKLGVASPVSMQWSPEDTICQFSQVKDGSRNCVNITGNTASISFSYEYALIVAIDHYQNAR